MKPSATSRRACCCCAAIARAFCSCRELLTRAWLENQVRGRAEISKDWFTAIRRRRPARAFGRPGRGHRQRAGAGQRRAGRAAGAGMGQAVSAALLYRAAARGRRIRRALCSARARARRPARIAGSRDAPGAVPQAGGISRPRSARVHRRGLRARRPAPAARVHAGELFQEPGGNGGAVRRYSRGARQQRRDRAPLQSHAGAGQEQAAAVSDAGGGESGGFSRAAGRAGPRAAPGKTLSRRETACLARARVSRAPGIRDQDHHPDGLLRLLPDRRRLHQLGQVERRAGRTGARLGRGFAGRLFARHHRPRSACATTCCSSAFSIRSGYPCPTSTSTSARTAATA